MDAFTSYARLEYREFLREIGCPEDKIEAEVEKAFPRQAAPEDQCR